MKYLSKSFRTLADLYLEPNGALKKDAVHHFLFQLPSTNPNLKKLFRKRYGYPMKWKPVKKGIYNGYSGDSVIKISVKDEIYFCKVFLCPKRGIREYLAYLYIAEWDQPLIKHTPILEIGKIRQSDGTEQIYLISKVAQGSQGISYIQALLKGTDTMTSLKLLLKTLGNALSTTHKQKTCLFSKKKLSTSIHHIIQMRLNAPNNNLFPLLQKLSKDPLLSSCYENFQSSLHTFITHPRTGSLCLIDTFFANYFFLPENGYLELIDQGDILLRLTSDKNYYWFAEDEIVNVLMLLHLMSYFRDLCTLPHLKNRFPIITRAASIALFIEALLS